MARFNPEKHLHTPTYAKIHRLSEEALVLTSFEYLVLRRSLYHGNFEFPLIRGSFSQNFSAKNFFQELYFGHLESIQITH